MLQSVYEYHFLQITSGGCFCQFNSVAFSFFYRRYKKENGITNDAMEEETMLLDEDNCI